MGVSIDKARLRFAGVVEGCAAGKFNCVLSVSFLQGWALRCPLYLEVCACVFVRSAAGTLNRIEMMSFRR